MAEFYERAGRVKCLGSPDRDGSVTVIGAVSPPGGDFTEPVSTHTMRCIKTFWALDTKLAYSRHYPSINWMTSYSGYSESVDNWWVENIDKDRPKLRLDTYTILQREDVLKEIVRLLGPEALPDEEKLILDVARMIKEGFLQQMAFDIVDTYCSPIKQVKMMRLYNEFYSESQKALKNGIKLESIRSLPLVSKIIRSKYEISDNEMNKMDELISNVKTTFNELSNKEVSAVVKTK